ncbi:TPA: DUF2986 domain-containing protein [Vibrio vulnificus]|nr:DUF2986 domain-containing protein [Vibrio vulnificus]ELK8326875.1 DUF2986 domain-containing protein [Vibrio vulnificus]ELN6895604.1 DUF2986 domain-containing protein [Vibrio vulnificus]ELU0080321.1 DUF2986 domain-containing protein [Vibrio vulnificus]ELV8713266.1 DUF2986 domain-containing protein [Vibrio vulnificus]
MNRKKKINQILKSKQKKQNAKLHKSNKPRYISKAERAKLDESEKLDAMENGADAEHSAKDETLNATE